METPAVSIIIPTFNHGAYIYEAITSVQNQTLQDFEIVVVDDGSTDETREIVSSFQDERIHYLYQENRGLPAARNTGIKYASSPLIALLDADDLFGPDKLTVATAFMRSKPETGLFYNGHIKMNGSGEPFLIHRVPTQLTLADLVLGYPFSPSDVVIRREWIERIGYYDESRIPNSEDLDLHLRLYQAGCVFSGVPAALNFRRMHANRRFRQIEQKLPICLETLERVFSSPDCPHEVAILRDTAYSNHYLGIGQWALAQSDTELGLSYFAKATSLNPTLANTDRLARRIMWMSLIDGSDHDRQLNRIATQIQGLLPQVSQRLKDWAVPQGFIIRGLLEVLWDREASGEVLLGEVEASASHIDMQYLQSLEEQLTLLRITLGPKAASESCERVYGNLRRFATSAAIRQSRSRLAFSQAIEYYREAEFGQALPMMLSSISHQPSLLFNRGALAVLVKSAAAIGKNAPAHLFTAIAAGNQANGAQS